MHLIFAYNTLLFAQIQAKKHKFRLIFLKILLSILNKAIEVSVPKAYEALQSNISGGNI